MTDHGNTRATQSTAFGNLGQKVELANCLGGKVKPVLSVTAVQNDEQELGRKNTSITTPVAESPPYNSC